MIDDRRRAAARRLGGDADAALRALPELIDGVPLPGQGQTAGYLRALAGLAAGDLTVARVVEPHLDAAAILAQAGMTPEGAAALVGGSGARPCARPGWGVFAAEGPGVALTATRDAGGGWRLDGVKPWCSLADRLGFAVVTAHTGEGNRRAFATALDHPGVRPVAGAAWVSRGLAGVPSGPVDFAAVPAVPVGTDGWYLRRPGFAWGGIGVAAAWWGGARALADRLLPATTGRTPDQVAHLHLGVADATLYAAACVLADAAEAIDAGAAVGAEGELLAARVRAVCARAAEDVLALVGRALGPGPLAFEEEHARRVADLTVYVRQHHAERDLARLGQLSLGQLSLGQLGPAQPSLDAAGDRR